MERPVFVILGTTLINLCDVSEFDFDPNDAEATAIQVTRISESSYDLEFCTHEDACKAYLKLIEVMNRHGVLCQ